MTGLIKFLVFFFGFSLLLLLLEDIFQTGYFLRVFKSLLFEGICFLGFHTSTLTPPLLDEDMNFSFFEISFFFEEITLDFFLATFSLLLLLDGLEETFLFVVFFNVYLGFSLSDDTFF